MSEEVARVEDFVFEPKVTLISRPNFLDQGASAVTGFPEFTDSDEDSEKLVEFGGRVCYLSYGKGRKTNKEYIENLLKSGHGSVLEHANFTFCFEGVSRSLTHELVRHRAGFAFSQLSQRYVDEEIHPIVVPPMFQRVQELSDSTIDTEVKQICEGILNSFATACETSKTAYANIRDGLIALFDHPEDPLAMKDLAQTDRRKAGRGTARSVLPNAQETKIVVTANARSWRHFIEMRGSEHADAEIRTLAIEVLKILAQEAPNLFGDYTLVQLPDGSFAAQTQYRKV